MRDRGPEERPLQEEAAAGRVDSGSLRHGDQVDHHVEADQPPRDDGLVRLQGHRAALRALLHGSAKDRTSLRRVVGTARPDRCHAQALGADRTLALGTGEAGLPVRVAVAVDVTSLVALYVHVAFTPAEEASAAIGVVVDVLRATLTIAQALASVFERVLCGAEIGDARDLRARIPDSLVGGERRGRANRGLRRGRLAA